MKKTRIFAVLAAMAMGLAVFGCSNGDSDSSGGGSTGGSTSGGTTGGSTSGSGTSGGSTSKSAVFRSINFHRGTIQVECKADGTYLMTWFYGDYSTNKGKGTYTLDGTFENGTIHQHQTHSSDTLSSEWVKEEEDNDITVRDGKFTVDINSTTVTFTKVGSSGSGSGSESGSSGGSTSGGGTGSESGTTGGSTSYSIAISSDSNGTVEADKTSAQKGETITLSVSAREGYELNSITVMDASSKTITFTTVTPDKKYNFTMPSSNVTVTAVFDVKYVNPHSVGDIVLKDGTFIPYSKDLTLTDEQKKNAIAVIFYAGNRSDTLGARTLGVGLKTSKDDGYNEIPTIEGVNDTYLRGTPLQWAPKGTAGYNINFTQTASGDFGEGDLDGSDNWDIICRIDSNAQSTAATNYPAFNWVNTYASRYGITGMYADGWYMPTISELITVFSSEVANKIMDVFEKIDGSLSMFKNEREYQNENGEYHYSLENGDYWSSCQCSDLEFVAKEDISVTGYRYYDEEYYSDYRVFMHHKDRYAYVLAIHSF